MNARILSLSIWLFAAVLSLGVIPLAKKMALLDGGGSMLVAFSTSFVSGMLIFTWLAAQGQFTKLAELSYRDWSAVLLVGALGSGIVPLLGIYAMTESSASNRALFQSAYPVATAIAARYFLHERLASSSYIWIGFICMGLILMNLSSGIGLSFVNWTFWPLLATLPLIGLSDVIAKRALDDLTPAVISVGRAVGGMLVLIIPMPWVFTEYADVTSKTWLWILLAGACMAVFAVSLYQVFDRTLATVAASLIALAPLLTLALEVNLLDLDLNLLQWSGFALVLVSVLLLLRKA